MKHKLILFLLLLCSMQYVVAQSIRVTGTIQDEDGEPVIGATVQVKGTSQGTISDYDGNFAMEAPQNATLLISYVGMASQEVKAAATIRIVMATDSKALDEVIVVAYGQQRKEAITGAVSNLKAESIERRPIASATAALEGQALGVQVNNSYGEPGSEPTIRIRGFTSVNGSNSPLYVVNGVPMGGNMGDINPADIESLTVLKDASSAALYGNKAASGVILVTTKSGRIGEEAIRINATISQGWYQRATKEYERLDAKQYMETYWESNRNALYTGDTKGKYNTYSDANADALELVRNGIGENYNIFNKSWENLFDANGKITAGTEILDGYKDDLDWYEPIERTGNRSQYGISASGGTKKGAYYMSLGYLNEEGFMKKSSGERLTANLKVDVKPTSWLKMGSTLNASNQYYNSMTAGTGNSSSFINPFYFARNMAPVYPVHLHDPATGAYVLDGDKNKIYDSGEGGRGQSSSRHNVWETELDQDKTYRTTIDGTAYADIILPHNFTVTLKGNLNLRNSANKAYNNSIIGDGSGAGGRMSKTDYRYRNMMFQQLVNWRQTFKEKHSVEVMVGHENFNYKYDYDYVYKSSEKFANLMELSNFATMTTISGYQSGYKTEGFLSRAAYNYDQTYFVEGSFRRDGSSRFHKDHRWGNFWSLGGSWIASNEAFIRQFDWINYLKLRAGYGEVGQEASVGYYAWMALYGSTINGGDGAYYKSQNEASDITWETSRSASFALETNLFKRLNLSVEYYQRGSSNLLFDVNLPSSMGSVSTGDTRPTITKNFGTLVNKGWEIGINGDVIKMKDFNWNLGVNLNTLNNKIKKLPEEYGGKGSINGTKRYFEGHSIYDFWMYQFEGIDLSNGRSLYRIDDENYYVKGTTTEIEGKTELTEDFTVIDGKPYVYNTTYAVKDWSGSSIPKLFGSFTTSLRYRSFELSGLFTYQIGGKMIDYSYNPLMSFGTTPSALHVDVLKGWKPEDASVGIDPNGTPTINTALSSYNNSTSSRHLISSDYFVVKNVTLSYAIPRKVLKPIGLNGVTLSLSGENLAIFTKRQGMNPQQSFNGTNYNAYVPARVITFGLNLNF
ncbi:TonB-linked SusC/RagA family outer membrane protein [Parabacteroides sp. PFB2-10]|uniref:SusC/RagA family TonB-linked outer membrane protein n=1 Tax=Parabacteroides sp. PFB2-10 TaxID=1742405 RepID=UPI002475FBA3|nr:TonB-dependent receptor [Parabacteroides sp. PFB2-10]MDH6312638.1 TonB-linked SusC/RagA family outer membrane protein [Parabacteroides sp. PFB2-10]